VVGEIHLAIRVVAQKSGNDFALTHIGRTALLDSLLSTSPRDGVIDGEDGTGFRKRHSWSSVSNPKDDRTSISSSEESNAKKNTSSSSKRAKKKRRSTQMARLFVTVEEMRFSNQDVVQHCKPCAYCIFSKQIISTDAVE